MIFHAFCWLCIKFEFAFFAGHGILIRVLPPSFPALPVNELCLLSCFFGAVVGFGVVTRR